MNTSHAYRRRFSLQPVNAPAIAVTGYAQSSNGVWYYDVEINNAYTVRRRYNDFFKLYSGLQNIFQQDELPPFPCKTSVWSKIVGIDQNTLRTRKLSFERLLFWIESQPVAKGSKAYVNFLGDAPHSKAKNGYVSLHEYRSPQWYSSLHVTKERARRSTCDSLMAAHVVLKATSSFKRTNKVSRIQPDESELVPPRHRITMCV